MAGVKSFSMGGSPALRRPALVECTLRIRRASQPGVLVHNGSGLGRRGMRTAMEHLERQILGATCNSHFRIGVAGRILDRKVGFSVSKGQSILCTGRVLFIADRHTSRGA